MLKYVKCCFNWKVVVGLAVVALAAWVAAPGLVGRLLPTLVALICPLSMAAMVIGMSAMSRKEAPPASDTTAQDSLPVSREERLRRLELERLHIQAEMDQVAAHLRDHQASAAPPA